MPCERKTAALLAYLALEGPTARARLVALLWPDTPGAVGRNNLLHLLRRLRAACGADITRAGDPLALTDDVSVDVSVLSDEHATRALPGGAFLDGVDLDVCPDLHEWLLARRDLTSTRRAHAYRTGARQLEQQGRWLEAIALTERLLTLDPLDEDAHRTLMRLHYHNGDRPAALRAYHRCKSALQRELDTEPSAQTARLARRIDQGNLHVERDVSVTPPTQLPVSVLRPPTLLGREAAWAQLEDAWTAGKLIYLTGDPGVGKTRLAQDFVRSKGRALYLPARPGLRDIPYGSAARNARARLAAAPHAQLPDWARRGLSRVLPELRDGEDLPPLVGDQDRLQFFAAHMEMVRLTSPGFAGVITDDTQYYDLATVELGTYMLSRAPLGAREGMPRHISIFRRGELTPEAFATVDHLVRSGVAVLVELTGLDDDALHDLLRDLELPDPAALLGPLRRVTGGNPQFVLEAVKNVYERGTLDPDDLALGAPTTVLATITERLDRLPEETLQVARAAAVLRADFTIELVAQVLGTSLLDTASAWDELEAAHVMTGERFAHDLVLEAVLAGIPVTVSRLLHRAGARALARMDAEPARVARHWQEGGDLRQAAPWLLRSGEAAQRSMRSSEARRAYDEALRAYVAVDDTQGAQKAEQALDALARQFTTT